MFHQQTETVLSLQPLPIIWWITTTNQSFYVVKYASPLIYWNLILAFWKRIVVLLRSYKKQFSYLALSVVNVIITTGILFIVLYFVLSYIAEKRKVYRKKLHEFETSKSYSDNVFNRFKEELIMMIALGFLITGIFLCLSCLYRVWFKWWSTYTYILPLTVVIRVATMIRNGGAVPGSWTSLIKA